jgi:hypothetical protein
VTPSGEGDAVLDPIWVLDTSVVARVPRPCRTRRCEGPLAKVESDASAARLLRRAQHQYPTDFWINYDLGNALELAQADRGVLRQLTTRFDVGAAPERAAA